MSFSFVRALLPTYSYKPQMQSDPITPEQRPMHRLLPWLLLGLLVLGAKLVMVDRFAGEAPFDDEWDAFAAGLFAPAQAGALKGDYFLQAHNEHRILPTKLLAYGIFTLAGGIWDERMLQVASAFLHALVYVVLGRWLGGLLGRGQQRALWVGLAIVGLLPISPFNTLISFQSQFFFLFLFTFLAGWGALADDLPTFRWWVFPLAGMLAVVSMGSGGLAGAAVLVVVIVRSFALSRILPIDRWRFVIGAVLVLAMLGSRVEVARHAIFRAGDFGTFALAFVRLVAWPLVDDWWWSGPVLWWPWLALAAGLLLRRLPWRSSYGAVIFLGAWVLLQIAALAWARGISLTTGMPHERYCDILAIGLCVNFAATVILCYGVVRYTIWLRALTCLWIGLALHGLGGTTLSTSMLNLSHWRQTAEKQAHLCSWFLHTGQDDYITNRSPAETGYSDNRRLAMLLRTPAIKRILPASLGGQSVAGFQFPFGSGIIPDGYPPEFSPVLAFPSWGTWNAKPAGAESPIWISEPFATKEARIRVTAITMGGPGTAFVEFMTPSGQIRARAVLPSADFGWQNAEFNLPPGNYRLKVTDERKEGWLAIGAPQEITAGARAVRWFAAQGWTIVKMAGLFGLIWLLWPWLREPATDGLGESLTAKF